MEMDPSFTAPGCPWSEYELGNLVSCEARLCSWVRQPMNTASNLAFGIAAAALLLRYARKRERTDLHFALLCFAVGVSSTIGHAAQTRVLLLFDYLSQFLVFSYLIASGLVRLDLITRSRRTVAMLGLIATAFIPTLVLKTAGAYLVGLFISTLIGIEWLQHRRMPGATTGWLGGAVTLLGAALICYGLDTQRIICDPENHWFQLHSFWHMLTAASLAFAAEHYRRISTSIF